MSCAVSSSCVIHPGGRVDGGGAASRRLVRLGRPGAHRAVVPRPPETALSATATETDRLSAAKRAAEIAASLEEEIALGRLRPRERLLEDEIARRFATKRHVVRQALAGLNDLGIVRHEPNKGAAVRDFSPEEVEHLYEVRELVERRAAELIPMPTPPGLTTDLRAIHERHTAAAGAGDLRTVFRENLLFHRVMFAACGNAPLIGVVQQFAMRTHGIRSYTIGDGALLRRVCEEHEAMIRHLENGDRAALLRVVVAHLQPAKQAYLARMEALFGPAGANADGQ